MITTTTAVKPGVRAIRWSFKFVARKRGPKGRAEDPRIKKLEREIATLRRRNQRVEALLEIQKKASELLGIPQNATEFDEND